MTTGRSRGSEKFGPMGAPSKRTPSTKDLRRAERAGRAAQGLGSGGRSGGTKSSGGKGTSKKGGRAGGGNKGRAR